MRPQREQGAGHHRWRGFIAKVTDAAFWWTLIALLVVMAALGGLLLLAVERHDAFLRLRPVLCAEGMQDRQLIVLAMAAPLFALFVLLTAAEWLSVLENWLHDRPLRTLYGWLFGLLASALGALVLFSLRC